MARDTEDATDWTLQFPVGQAADDPAALRRVRQLARDQALQRTMVGCHVRPKAKKTLRRFAESLDTTASQVVRAAIRAADEHGMPRIVSVIGCQQVQQRCGESVYLGVWLSAPEIEALDRLIASGVAKGKIHNRSETLDAATTRSAVLRHLIGAIVEHCRTEALTGEDVPG